MADRPGIGADHAWFRARLDAHALGLLDEAEDARFESHAAACSECGAALKAHTENAARLAREGHIPAGILARWDTASVELRGMARRMVREHLVKCAECRQDLEAIGFSPELSPEPSLEEGAESVGSRTGTSMAVLEAPATPAYTIRVVQAPRRRWVPWLLGGGAGVALATAAAVLIVPALRVPAPVSDPVQGTSVPSRAPALQPRFVIDLLPPARELEGRLRSGGGGPLVVEVGPRGHFIQLGLPELFLADTTMIDLRVVGPGGGELAQVRHLYDRLGRRGTLLFGSPEAELAPGVYRVIITAPFASNSTVAEFEFRVERRP